MQFQSNNPTDNRISSVSHFPSHSIHHIVRSCGIQLCEFDLIWFNTSNHISYTYYISGKHILQAGAALLFASYSTALRAPRSSGSGQNQSSRLRGGTALDRSSAGRQSRRLPAINTRKPSLDLSRQQFCATFNDDAIQWSFFWW